MEKFKSDNFKHISTVASQNFTSWDEQKMLKLDSFNLKGLVSLQRGQIEFWQKKSENYLFRLDALAVALKVCIN